VKGTSVLMAIGYWLLAVGCSLLVLGTTVGPVDISQ
jgi:hypothetical protein